MQKSKAGKIENTRKWYRSSVSTPTSVGPPQTMINPLSSKDYKRTNWSYTLKDSFLDNVVVALNLLRESNQRAPLNLKVSSRNQKDLFSKN